ncbi:MAG: hypothetical protein ABI895_06100 [Deltaproteobacteria bacterium]
MIKLNDTGSTNLTVLAEGELTQVVGGCGYRRSYRPRRHCWGWRRRYDSSHQGFEGRGFEGQDFSEQSFESEAPEFEPSESSSEDPAAAPAV